jgi:hypothetical protein
MSKIHIRPADYVSREAKFQERDLALARRFADEHADRFDDKFLSSLESQFLSSKFLTERQYDALQNIMTKWRMEEWDEEQ